MDRLSGDQNGTSASSVPGPAAPERIEPTEPQICSIQAVRRDECELRAVWRKFIHRCAGRLAEAGAGTENGVRGRLDLKRTAAGGAAVRAAAL